MSIASVDIIDHPTLSAESAMSATEKPVFTFLPLGAILQKFELNGLNIVQGFNTTDEYREYNAPYFGETIGRVANRISGAKINRLNGRSYLLDANNGPNSLHGGVKGWGKRLFEGPSSVERNKKQSIQFKYQSADGEEGFPGTVETRVFYTATTVEHDGRQVANLEVEYEAELIEDDGVEETVVAMTNHR
jgi:aldose 1-epimerase